MTYATADDVAARLGRALTSDEATQAYTLLGDAERRIRRRIGDLDAQVTAETIDLDSVIQVEAAAVRRVLLNPEAFAQEGVDDYRYTRADGVADGEIYISDAEWDLLLPSGALAGDSFSIRMAGSTPCP